MRPDFEPAILPARRKNPPMGGVGQESVISCTRALKIHVVFSCAPHRHPPRNHPADGIGGRNSAGPSPHYDQKSRYTRRLRRSTGGGATESLPMPGLAGIKRRVTRNEKLLRVFVPSGARNRESLHARCHTRSNIAPPSRASSRAGPRQGPGDHYARLERLHGPGRAREKPQARMLVGKEVTSSAVAEAVARAFAATHGVSWDRVELVFK